MGHMDRYCLILFSVHSGISASGRISYELTHQAPRPFHQNPPPCKPLCLHRISCINSSMCGDLSLSVDKNKNGNENKKIKIKIKI